MRRAQRVVVAFCVLAAVGCGSSPSSPSTTITGTWSGTTQDNIAGQGVIRMTIAQNNTGLGGSWTDVFPNASEDNEGTLVASSAGSTMSITLTPNSPGCPIGITGTLSADHSELNGTYSAINCGVTLNGNIDMTRLSQ